jgi:hypothetical protein
MKHRQISAYMFYILSKVSAAVLTISFPMFYMNFWGVWIGSDVEHVLYLHDYGQHFQDS